MKPYYQDKYVTIYNGKCEDYIDLAADLLLTDPPYGIGESLKDNHSRSCIAVSKDYGISDWDKTTVDSNLIQKWINSTKYSIVWGGQYYPLSPVSCWLIWDKENGENDFADCEMAWTNLKMATRIFRFRWQGMLQGDMKNKEIRVHPTQKPLPLMKWRISKIKEPITSIIDPFMGSGTTCLAAKVMNIPCIGIEISEKYCELAAKRCSQEVMELGI